jgi:hypothetical protein
MKTVHKQIFARDGVFAGWPANYGMWRAQDGIRTGFFVSEFRAGDKFHAFDYDSTDARHIQIISTDEGETWMAEDGPVTCPPLDFMMKKGKVRRDAVIGIESNPRMPEPNTMRIDLLTPGTRILFSRNGWSHRPRSWWVSTTNGGRTWSPPKAIPILAPWGVAARTDYCVRDDGVGIIPLTIMREDGIEGRTLMLSTADGITWNQHGLIGPRVDSNCICYNIMASPVFVGRRSAGRDAYDCLIAIRRRKRDRNHILVYRYNSAAGTSSPVATDVETGFGGNPPTLVRTRSGRNFLAWWKRADPATTQKPTLLLAELCDRGEVRGKPHVLRVGLPGAYDLGYCRAIERTDGKILIVYYFDDGRNRRTIESTIVDVNG